MTKYDVWVDVSAVYKIQLEANSRAEAEEIAKEEAARYVKSGYLVSYATDVIPTYKFGDA